MVLFEPSLQIPLLRASAAPGEADETVFVEGVPSGNGRRLAELVRTMNGLDFLPAAASSLAAEGGGWRFSLSGWVGEAACKFPERISVEHHLGGPRIDVETTDVSCAEPAR